MRHRYRFLAAIILAIACPALVSGQNLEERLREVGNQYAAAYVAPLVDGLGANINSGLFQAAHFGRRDTGLDVYLGVRVMGTPLSGGDESFSLSYEGSTTLDVDVGPSTQRLSLPATFTVTDAPAIFGNTDPGSATVHVRQDTTVSYLGVLLPVSVDTTFSVETIGALTEDLSLVPFAVLQGGVGTFFGTSLMIRWLPAIEVTDLGRFGFFGFGVRHDLGQYLPLLPFNLAVQGAWQRVRVQDADTDVVTASAFAANLEASKRFGAITLFGGVQTEETRIRVDYEAEADDPVGGDLGFPIDLDLRSATTMRLVVGADVATGPVHFYGDLNLGSRTAFTAGVGVAF